MDVDLFGDPLGTDTEGNEVFLDAVHIPEYSQGHWTNHSAKRIRKLLDEAAAQR